MDAVVVGYAFASAMKGSFLIVILTLCRGDTSTAYLGFIITLWAISVILIYRRLPLERWIQALGEQ